MNEDIQQNEIVTNLIEDELYEKLREVNGLISEKGREFKDWAVTEAAIKRGVSEDKLAYVMRLVDIPEGEASDTVREAERLVSELLANIPSLKRANVVLSPNPIGTKFAEKKDFRAVVAEKLQGIRRR